MFNDEEDYSFFTGGIGDVNDDGIVDEVEYLMEEDEYFQIMEGEKDDDSILGDDDFDIVSLAEAEELGINPDEYIDSDDFEAALEEARTKSAWKAERQYDADLYNLDLDDYETEEEFDEAIENLDDSELALEEAQENAAWKEAREDDANIYGLDLDDYETEEEFDEAIEEIKNNTDRSNDTVSDDNINSAMGAYAVAFASMKNKYGLDKTQKPKNPPSESHPSPTTASIERRYYDREDRKYRIGDAIYDNFKEVRDNYTRYECEDFFILIEKIYSVDKELGVTIWVWAIYNFPGALVNRGVDEWNSQAWCLTDCIFNSFASTDNESDDEEESTSIFRYVSQNPDLEDIIFNKTYVDEHLSSLTSYIPYCIKNNLRDNFLRVYNGIMTNRFRDEKKMSKYSIIEDLLVLSSAYGVREADPWFYAFFEKEIKALNQPLKEAYLMKKLNEEEFDIRVFLKPEKENLELDDEYFGESDKPHEISAEEYKKLKNENKALKSKVTKLENQITDLNHNIRRLESDLEAARKAKVKEWDGKYYRYCRVTLDECPGGLWYRTDDITLKKGDYVYVPYGKENEELMAKVVSVEEFRSDDLPFPLQRTKFIIEKCDA